MDTATMTSITTAITDAQADIVTIGGLIVIVAAAVFAIRWVKAQFF